MNTDNFSVQGSLDGNYLNIELAEPVHIDEIALKVMEQDCPDFFLPFKMVDINDSITLKYKLVNNIALLYSDTQMDKKTFVKLFSGLVKPFIECKDWMLNYRNICIDPQYIYIDNGSGTARFIYIPEGSYTNEDSEIFAFLKNTFVSRKITDDADFQVKMFQFFMREDITLAELYALLKEEEGKQSVKSQPVIGNAVQQATPVANVMPAAPVASVTPAPYSAPKKTPVAPQPVKQEPASAKKKKEEPKKKESSDDLFGDIFGDSISSSSEDELFGDIFDGKNKKKAQAPEQKPEKTEKKSGGFGGFGLFGGKKNKQEEKSKPAESPKPVNSVPQSQPIQPMQPVMMTDDLGKTEILDDSFEVSRIRPRMSLVSSPIEGALKVIFLDAEKGYSVIGRISNDPVQPDVCFPPTFKRIGRKHARVQTENGKYYIIDLGSQNKTLFNGVEMIPNQKYELTSGAEISFTASMPVVYRVEM